MTTDLHARAEKLIAQTGIEGISSEEQAWLQVHLAECAPCAAVSAQTSSALASLRAISVDLPRDLASRTQLRVRLRADELREQEPRRRILWVLAFMSWALGVSTAPFVWRFFAWAGEGLGLPRMVSQAGAVLWWTMPVLLAVGLILIERRGRTEFSE